MTIANENLINKQDIVDLFNSYVYTYVKSQIYYNASNPPPYITSAWSDTGWSEGDMSYILDPGGWEPGNSASTASITDNISAANLTSYLIALTYNLTKVRNVNWIVYKYHTAWGDQGALQEWTGPIYSDTHMINLSSAWVSGFSPANYVVDGDIISSASINNFIASLRASYIAVTSNPINIYKHVCHASCHSSCHSNRGRR